MKTSRLPSPAARTDMAWLIVSALVALIICAGTITVVLHLERPAQAVQQGCVTTTAARG